MENEHPRKIICFYCREEIPAGWPVTFHQSDEGNLQIVHRFRNMCVTGRPAVDSNDKGEKK